MDTNHQPDYFTGPCSTVYCTKTRKYHRVRVIRGVPYVTVKRNTRVLYQGINPTTGMIHLNGETVYLIGKIDAL